MQELDFPNGGGVEVEWGGGGGSAHFRRKYLYQKSYMLKVLINKYTQFSSETFFDVT